MSDLVDSPGHFIGKQVCGLTDMASCMRMREKQRTTNSDTVTNRKNANPRMVSMMQDYVGAQVRAYRHHGHALHPSEQE